nr:minor coat protein [Sweet potato chlorotic stunt virus]
MEIVDVAVGNIISTNYPEDEQTVVTRATGCKFNQDYSLPYKDGEQVDLSIPYGSPIRSKPVTVELYFHIGEGYVVYTCRPSDNFNQKVFESNLGAFFSSFTNLVTPRRPRGTNSFRFGYLRTRNDCYILVEGWRIVQIPNAGKISGVSLRLTIDVGDLMFSKTDKLSAKIINLSSCINSDRPDGLFRDLEPNAVSVFSESTQENNRVTPNGKISLGNFNSVSDLNLKILRGGEDPDLPKDLNEFDKSKTVVSSEIDKSRVFRIYYSNFIDSGFKSSLTYSILWPNIIGKGIDVNHQFWLGERENMLEGGLQYKSSDSNNHFFFVHRKGDVSNYYKIDESITARILKTLPTELLFSIVKGAGGKYTVYVNGEKLLTTIVPNVSNKVQLGWVLKLYKEKVSNFDRTKLKTFEVVPRETQVKCDGELIALRKHEFPVSEFNACGWTLEKKPGLRLRSIKDVNEMFAVDDVKETPGKTDDPTQKEEPKPENKVDVLEDDGKLDLTKDETERFALKAVVYLPLSKIDDERIFNSMVKWYVSQGVSSRQAEYLIYQMGVSFCTSMNSCANTNLKLVVSKSDGSLLQVSKAEHVLRMQLLCSKYCNVERTLLRNRSDAIFKLLKARILVPPIRHARNRGLKPNMAHMACDFMDYSNIPLSDEEQLALTSIQRYVLTKNKNRRSIVNVNQLY